MKINWFKPIVSKTKDMQRQISVIRNEIGKEEDETISNWFTNYWMGSGIFPIRKTLIERIGALEKANKMLVDYLGIELHRTQAQSSYRKKPQRKGGKK